MALNKNHEFEELNGIKCGIVEKNVKPERLAFLKELLEFNGYEVIAVPSPPPKVAAAPPKPASTEADGTQAPVAIPEPQTTTPPPETFTVGVTDYTFNPINAIFGRLLKTKDRHFISWAYWNQEEAVNDDEVPYYEKEN